MTGLDPRRHAVVELACLITDDELELVAEGPDLVVHVDDSALDAMEDVVRDMHAKSGLTEAVRASTLSLDAAGGQVMDFLRSHIAEPRSVPLCGNSIGTDRRFLAEHLPDLERFFHYRSIDVSTIKELCRRWYPEALSAAPTKKGGHRAMDDIKESLQELRYYRKAIFRDRPPRPGAAPPAGPGHAPAG